LSRRRGVSPVIASILLIVIVVASSAVVYSATNSLSLTPKADAPAILENLKIIQVSADASVIYLFILNRGGVDTAIDSVYVESCGGELLLRHPVSVDVPAGETVSVAIPKGGLDLSKPLNFKIAARKGYSASTLAIVQPLLVSPVPSSREYFPQTYSVATGTYAAGVLPDSVQHVDGAYFGVTSAPAYVSPAYSPAAYSVQTGSYVNGSAPLLSIQDGQSMCFLSSASTQISRTYYSTGYTIVNGTLAGGSLPDTYANDTAALIFDSYDVPASILYPLPNMNLTSGGDYWQASSSEAAPSVGPSSVTNASSDFVFAGQRAVARTGDANSTIHVIYTDNSYLRYAVSVDGGRSFVDHAYISNTLGGGELGMHPAIAPDVNNNLHIAYEWSSTSPNEIGYLLFGYNSSYGGNPQSSPAYLQATGTTSLAAHFIAFSSELETVQLYLGNASSSSALLTVELRTAAADGTPDLSPSGLVASATLDQVPASMGWVNATLGATLEAGAVYAIVLDASGGAFRWGYTETGYTGTRGGWSYASGAWTESAARNFCFAVPGWPGWTFSAPTAVRSVSTGTTLNRPAIAVYPYLTGTDQSFSTGTSTAAVYGSNYYAQSFTPLQTNLAGVMLYLSTTGSPDHLRVEVRVANGAAPDMSDAGLLSSGYIDGGRTSATPQWYDCALTRQIQLNASQTYWIVLKSPSSPAGNYWSWSYNAAGGYAGGNAAESTSGGGTWTARAWDFRFMTCTELDERPAIAWHYQQSRPARLRIEFLRCIPEADPASTSSWMNMAGTSTTPDILYSANTADTTTRLAIAAQPNTNALYVFYARSGTLRYNRIYGWNPVTGNWGSASSAATVLTGVSNNEFSAAPNAASDTVVLTAVTAATGYTNVYYYDSRNTRVDISPASTPMRNASATVIAGRIYVVYNNATNISYQYYDGAWSGEVRFYNGTSSSAPNAVYAPRASSVDFVWLSGPSSLSYGSVYPTGIVNFTGPTYDPGNGNPSGSGGGSIYAQADDHFVDYSFHRANYTFYSGFTTPTTWGTPNASFAWRFDLSGSSSYPYGTSDGVTLYSVRLIVADSSGNDLFLLYTDDNGGAGWRGTSVGYFYRTGISADYPMAPATAYRLKVVFDVGCSDPGDLSKVTFRVDDVGISFQSFASYLDLEFYGPGDTDDWDSICLDIVSRVSTVPTSMLVRVYNYALDRYPLSGEQGYFNYTVTTAEEESRILQITSGANNFRAADGSWRISINGSAELAGFQFALNMLDFAPRVNVHSASVEFSGASDVDDWLAILWGATHAFSTPTVEVTIQLYNYTASAYPSSGFGYYAYTSGQAYTYEPASGTTSDNAADYRDASGNWRMLVTATKVGNPFYMLSDYILYSPTETAQEAVDACFIFTGVNAGYLLNMTYNMTSLLSVGSLNVTFQIWDYSASRWSGIYSTTYTSSPAPNTPQSALIVVTSDLQRYVSSGETRVRVSTESLTLSFNFSADQVELTVWASGFA